MTEILDKIEREAVALELAHIRQMPFPLSSSSSTFQALSGYKFSLLNHLLNRA